MKFFKFENSAMIKKSLKHHLILLVMLGFFITAHSSEPVITKTLLSADFNDLSPGDSLGEGGAIVGEPIEFDLLDNEVIEDVLGENYLLISNASGINTPMNVIWQFLNDEEVMSNLVTLNFKFTPTTLDRYSLSVRENGDSAQDFLTVTYNESGTFSASDAAGNISLSNNSFTANIEQDISIEFNMDTGSSQMTINGQVLFTNRSHGISDRGVGSLLTGYADFNNTTPFLLDEISVFKTIPLPLVLDADFEDKILGDSIGTGGATFGEPSDISNNLVTEIITYGVNNQALFLDNTNGNALNLNWTLLNEREITTGIVAVETDIEFNALDQYRITVSGINTSPVSFISLTFGQTGAIGAFNTNGFIGFIGSYVANQKYRLRLVFNLDADLYDVLLDDTVLIEDQFYSAGGNGGIYQVATGFQSSAQMNSIFVIDNLQVRATAELSDDIFANGFE